MERNTRTSCLRRGRTQKGLNKKVFNPRAKFLQVWNKMFLISCVLAVSCDPLVFYISYIDRQKNCMDVETDVAMTVTMLRTILDGFYVIRMVFQSRTAVFDPFALMFGRRILVTDSTQIAKRYMRGELFVIDFLSVLPLPQLVVWRYLLYRTALSETKTALLVIVLLQYIPRFIRVFPLVSELKMSGVVFVEFAFLGPFFAVFLLILSSHIIGSFWYLLALQRNVHCWTNACKASPDLCTTEYLYCVNDRLNDSFPTYWKTISGTFLKSACSAANDDNPSQDIIKFGIYKQALQSGIFSETNFVTKYMYSLWWGMRNLTSVVQGLEASCLLESLFSLGRVLGSRYFGISFWRHADLSSAYYFYE